MSGPCTDCGGPDYQTLMSRNAELESHADHDEDNLAGLEHALVLANQRYTQVETERDKYKGHIKDIAAHATPFGDIPDDPGWIGSYMLSAGALHRALGTLGHTMPSCQAEAELKARESLPLSCGEGCDGCPPPMDCPLDTVLADCVHDRVRKAKLDAESGHAR